MRSTLSSTSGDSPRAIRACWRLPTRTSSGTAAATTPSSHTGQPSVRPSTSGKTTRKLTAAVIAMPSQSRRAPWWAGLLAGSTRRPTTIANSPTGTLMRNSERQSVPNGSALINAPAITGPSTVESPIAGPKAAKALPMSAGPKMSRISPKVCGIISAAASPWATRPATSTSPDHATEHSTEDATKPTSPVISIRLRP